MYTNLSLWIKENLFQLTKLSLIQRNVFFNRITKKCFFGSKKLFSQCSGLLKPIEKKVCRDLRACDIFKIRKFY